MPCDICISHKMQIRFWPLVSGPVPVAKTGGRLPCQGMHWRKVQCG